MWKIGVKPESLTNYGSDINFIKTFGILFPIQVSKLLYSSKYQLTYLKTFWLILIFRKRLFLDSFKLDSFSPTSYFASSVPFSFCCQLQLRLHFKILKSCNPRAKHETVTQFSASKRQSSHTYLVDNLIFISRLIKKQRTFHTLMRLERRILFLFLVYSWPSPIFCVPSFFLYFQRLAWSYLISKINNTKWRRPRGIILPEYTETSLSL